MDMLKSPDNQEVYELLQGFDLSEKEALVYLGALKLGNALVKDIARQAGLNRTTTYNLLLGLRKMGLVASYQKDKLTYFSVSAPSALRTLADQRINRQEELKTKLNELLPLLNGLFQSRSRSSTVKIYEGIDSLPEIYQSVYRSARYPTEGLEFTNWGNKYKLFPQRARDETVQLLMRNNIQVRSLLIEDELTRGWLAKDAGRSQNKIIRLLPNPGWDFFCNLELCENRFAIVTYKNNNDAQGVVIESTELASMIRFMFDSLWEGLKA
jgi:DNA-binding transcriptional ArsR family regulator